MIYAAFGGSEATIAQWIADYGESEVNLAFEHVKAEIPKRTEKNPIKSPIGYLGWYLTNKKVIAKTGDQYLLEDRQKKAEAKLEKARQDQEAIEEQEAQMQLKRAEKEACVAKVTEFLSSLSDLERQQLDVDYVSENQEPPRVEQMFFDWIAEKHGFGNPYPAYRAERMQKALSQSLSL